MSQGSGAHAIAEGWQVGGANAKAPQSKEHEMH